jgi:hypothetical protein
VQAEKRTARGRERRRARAQEGASTGGREHRRARAQEGASTGGREHRRRKLRGERVGGLPKEPANNPQSLRVKPPKYRNSFSFAGSFAGYCNSLYDKHVDQPANVNSGLPNAVNDRALCRRHIPSAQAPPRTAGRDTNLFRFSGTTMVSVVLGFHAADT